MFKQYKKYLIVYISSIYIFKKTLEHSVFLMFVFEYWDKWTMNMTLMEHRTCFVVTEGTNKRRGTHLREGVAARNWFTTIDVSSAIAFPVEGHDRINNKKITSLFKTDILLWW